MRIDQLTEEQYNEINEQFEKAIYLRLKAQKIVGELKKRYGLSQSQLYRLISKPMRLMKRHQHE